MRSSRLLSPLFFPKPSRQGSIGEVSIVRRKSLNGSNHGSAHGSYRTTRSKQLSFLTSPLELKDVSVEEGGEEAGEGGVGGGQLSLPSPRLEPGSGTVSEVHRPATAPFAYAFSLSLCLCIHTSHTRYTILRVYHFVRSSFPMIFSRPVSSRDRRAYRSGRAFTSSGVRCGRGTHF